MKGSSKIIASLLAAVGAILFGVGISLFSIHPVLPFLAAVVAVPLVENQFVLDVVRECRKQRAFAWKEKSVRTDLLCMLLTLLFLWIVLYIFLRVKFGVFWLF